MTWNISGLSELLAKHDQWAVTANGDCLCITNEDGLDAYLAVSGEQIVVENVLFARDQVEDAAGLNESILKTHKLFPLTTVGITSIEGDEYYACFGALSSQSKEDSVIIEVETLFDNVAGFLDAYEPFLK